MLKRRMLARGLAVSIVLGLNSPTLKVYANTEGIIQGDILLINDKSDKKEEEKKKEIEKYVEAFKKEGILKGYDEEGEDLRLEDKITRAEFIKLVNKTLGFTQKNPNTVIEFKDITKDVWCYEDIQIAVERGYIVGYEDGTFRPNEEITREEMSKIVGVLLNIKEEGETEFKDNEEISNWSKGYIKGLLERKIVGVYKNSVEFNPKEKVSREESIVTLGKAREFKWKEEGQGVGISHVGGSEEHKENKEEKEEKEELPRIIEAKNEKALKGILNEEGVSEVRYTGDYIKENITIPEDKTIILDNDMYVTDKLRIEGQVILKGKLKIERGGYVLTSNKGTIEGEKGEIEVKKGGKVQIEDVENVGVNIKTNRGGTLEIEGGIILNEEGTGLLTLRDNTSNINLLLQPRNKDKGKIEVEGFVSVNEDIEYTLKASPNTTSYLLVKDREDNEGGRCPVKVSLEGVTRLSYGYYGNYKEGSWGKLTNKHKITKTITETEEEGLLEGDLLELTKEIKIEEEQVILSDEVKIDVSDNKGRLYEGEVDVDNTEEITILVSIPEESSVTGVKVNGVPIKINKVVEGGSILTIRLTREEYKELYMDLFQAGLNIEVLTIK